MQVTTKLFGKQLINPKDIISFSPKGPLGCENLLKYFIIDPNDRTNIQWLQSIDNPSIAFPILNPILFEENYYNEVKLLHYDIDDLQIQSDNDYCIYTIITIPRDIKSVSANLLAPIIINKENKLAKQVVLPNNKLATRFFIYEIYLKNKITIKGTMDKSNRFSNTKKNIRRENTL